MAQSLTPRQYADLVHGLTHLNRKLEEIERKGVARVHLGGSCHVHIDVVRGSAVHLELSRVRADYAAQVGNYNIIQAVGKEKDTPDFDYHSSTEPVVAKRKRNDLSHMTPEEKAAYRREQKRIYQHQWYHNKKLAAKNI